MDNQYPRMLYKAGGREPIHGGHFATVIVPDAEQHKNALAQGWHDTTPDALAAHEAAQAAAITLTVESGPPTRDELEQKATELGITPSPRISDKKLAAAIAAKLAG